MCIRDSLLLSVLRLLPASAVVSGDVCFHGQSLFALSPKQMEGVRGGQISYVPQGSGNGMNPLLSVGFQVGEPLIAHRGMNKKRAIARAVELMSRFHLGREEELARQYPYTLSGGMRPVSYTHLGHGEIRSERRSADAVRTLHEKRADAG